MKTARRRARSFYTPRKGDSVALRFDISEILTSVWCVRYPKRKCCTYILETSPGAVVIDAGPEASARGIMMGLQHARLGLSSIRAIVLTDSAPDQSAGAPALATRSGASVLCASSHSLALAAPGQTTPWQRLRGVPTREPYEVSGRLAPGQSVERLEVIEGRSTAGSPLALYERADALLFNGTNPAEAFQEHARWVLPAIGRPHEVNP